MARLCAVLFLLAGYFSTVAAQDVSFDAGAKPHAGIDAVYAKFSKAYRELDHELVGGLYSADAAYLVPDQEILTGRDNVTLSFKSFFDAVREGKGRLEIRFKIVQRKVSGDMAYDVGIYTLTRFNEAGAKVGSGQGKFVVVAIKETNGEWKFQVDGYSGLPQPKQ